MLLLRELLDVRRVSVETPTESFGKLSQPTVGAVVIGSASSEMMQIVAIRVGNESGFNLKRLSVQAKSLPARCQQCASMKKRRGDSAIPASLPVIFNRVEMSRLLGAHGAQHTPVGLVPAKKTRLQAGRSIRYTGTARQSSSAPSPTRSARPCAGFRRSQDRQR